MMNPTFGLLISATLIASAAVAQPATPRSATETPPAAAVAGPDAAPASPPNPSQAKGKQVEGLTVTGKRPETKTCSSRDRACIAEVVAELKQLYPEELKTFCFQRQTRAVRTAMVADQLGVGGGPPVSTSLGVNSALATACAPDKK
jgi:hypothetical protein